MIHRRSRGGGGQARWLSSMALLAKSDDVSWIPRTHMDYPSCPLTSTWASWCVRVGGCGWMYTGTFMHTNVTEEVTEATHVFSLPPATAGRQLSSTKRTLTGVHPACTCSVCPTSRAGRLLATRLMNFIIADLTDRHPSTGLRHPFQAVPRRALRDLGVSP